jgi:hypothetical protein
MPTARLMLGDCLERMAEIEAGSVTAIVTDPPYGQSNESYDRGVSPEVWRECFRVAGPDAALISFAGGPTYHRIASGIEAAGWQVRQMWGWVYRDGLITSAWPKEGFDRLVPAMDPICYATKGKVLLNLQREGDATWRRGPRGCNLSARSDGVTAATSGHGRRPRTIFAEADVPGFEYFAHPRARRDPDPTGHPNQKPLALMRWLVSKLPMPVGTACPECHGKGRPAWPASVVATSCLDCGGKGRLPAAPAVILDPYMGSGTTLLAALAEGFEAIGIEDHEPYFRIAESRIAAARTELPLFAPPA